MPIKNITLMEDLLTSHDLENMYIYGIMECQPSVTNSTEYHNMHHSSLFGN